MSIACNVYNEVPRPMKEQVLVKIPLPMPCDLFVDILNRLKTKAFPDKKLFIRNGDGFYEIFERIEEESK